MPSTAVCTAEEVEPMHAALHTLEVRNALWPEGAGVVPPDKDEAAYWRDVQGRPFALPELLLGADEASRALLRAGQVRAISVLLRRSLADTTLVAGEARAMRHRARRLIGEIDGWWAAQAREARESGR